MAEALLHMDDYLISFKETYRRKRDFLVSGLRECGFDVTPPAGTYFIIAHLEAGQNDVDYCQELICKKKVAAIPTSAFYLKSLQGQRMIRFCFAKNDETLKAAVRNLSLL